MLEGLNQLGHAAEGHGKGQMGASVAVRDLNALVAEIPFPLDVTADLILTEDV